jgi:hypothetical protein
MPPRARFFRKPYDIARVVDQCGPSKGSRFQHLDLVAPGIEVPAHFEMARGAEPDRERPIGFVFQGLFRMEYVASRVLSGFWAESPRHVALFVVLLVNTKGAVGECLKIEPSGRTKLLSVTRTPTTPSRR